MPANYRLDAWVTPPAYTGRPPMILPGLRPGEPSQPRSTAAVSVPAGSTLVVRATGQSGLDVAVSGGIAEAKTGANAAPQAPKGTEEKHFTIADAGSATVKGFSEDVTWRFTAVPDRPPTIALAKEPEPQLRGSLLLNYKLEDDYGVIDAQATFERKAAASDAGRQGAASALRGTEFPAGAAAGADPQWCCVHHQGLVRSSVGRRRRDHDARRPRRRQ